MEEKETKYEFWACRDCRGHVWLCDEKPVLVRGFWSTSENGRKKRLKDEMFKEVANGKAYSVDIVLRIPSKPRQDGDD